MSTTYTDLPETAFPDALDDLSRMSDLVASDMALVNQYYSYYNAGNLAAAAQLLADNPTLINKLFNAAKFNILRDALIALERFYLSDVETYIDSTRQTLQGEIDKFTALGEYSATAQYVKHNVVTHNGNGYVCTADCKGKTPGTTDGANYWQLIVSKGEKGDSGTGLSFRGTYSPTTSYTVDDCVTDGTSIWAAMKSSTGQPLTEGEYWTKAMQIGRQSVTATLTASAWSDLTQTINVADVTANSTIFVSPDPASYEVWGKAGIICTEQDDGTLTFTCKKTPTASVTANIVIFWEA